MARPRKRSQPYLHGGLTDINEVMSDKNEINEAVFYNNYKEIKEDMNSYRKLEDIRNEDFRSLPDYIIKDKSLDKVRMAYRIRTKMVNDIKVNYKDS